MKTIIHRADSRGFANHGWLQANHSFSFANYFDKDKVHFGVLRVLNDDIIAPKMGFGTHPHDNMEIITIPLSGVLKHRDNMHEEWQEVLAGEVQVMSAGTGV
ncbi:pirin family protein [Oceanihabitans sediminis]|nr:pirin family protein [Oceanihabitans sediminis]MDX1773407.1 pirin family protein [Oceanihabitans sediminis]